MQAHNKINKIDKIDKIIFNKMIFNNLITLCEHTIDPFFPAQQYHIYETKNINKI